MNYRFILLFVTICFSANVNTAICQEITPPPTEKEIKKKFRELRRKAPNRVKKKELRVFEKEYFALLTEDKQKRDSIEQQKAVIEALRADVQKGRMTEGELDSLRAENDSLRAIMRAYVMNIDSLNTLNLQLESKRNNAEDYYFNLSDFEEPKIYFYYNQADPENSQYWKLSSNIEDSTLVTEAYTIDFDQFEFFKEKYDSTGSKVVEYVMINGSDSLFCFIDDSDVYRWSPKESITYIVKYPGAFYDDGYTKTREFGSVDSMDVLGNKREVMRFQDEYFFYEAGQVVFSRMQQSFYAKRVGMVRFLRFDQFEKKNVTFILEAVYSEQEWMDLKRAK